MRFAAVDIGSNAVRLLFCDVYPDGNGEIIKKTSLVRLPIRLGEEVFTDKFISASNIEKLHKSIESFKLLCQVYNVIDYRVCATSAMREAENGEEIVKSIEKNLEVKVDIISGEEEAELIYGTGIAEKIENSGTYLYVDVGGGSTELALFSNGEKMDTHSFKIGTIRLKNYLVKDKAWDELQSWVRQVKRNHQPQLIIATGGNINKLYKLIGLKDYQLLDYRDLDQMNSFIEKYSLDQRISKLGLKPDRADVITHAGKIYLNVMKYAGVENMFVPKVGLADGIIKDLYKKHKLMLK